MRIFCCFLALSALLCSSCNSPSQHPSDAAWTQELRAEWLCNRADSSTWDSDMLATDMQALASGFQPGPMPVGAFPVPSYSLLGEDSFHGVGFYSGDRPFGRRGNHLIYTSFLVNRNKFNTQYIPADKPGEAFFTIVVLSDAVIDTVDYSHCFNGITSRNNPDFVGQGSIRTEASNIDYIAFQTADRINYALVNMRLFDLAHGRIILIAPYRDGSLQSLQVASYAIYSLDDVESVIDRVLSDQSALRFLEAAERSSGAKP